MTDREAMLKALDALEILNGAETVEGIFIYTTDEIFALRQALAQPEQAAVAWMRMPKEGDRVVCIEDESLGTVKYLTAGGSPEIKFDDGSHGTYLLREFAELFRYADTALAQPKQEHIECGYDETVGMCTNNPCCEQAQPEPVVPFPSFMRRRIEEAMDLAINPKGMSVHDGKATVLVSDLHRMLLVIDSAPPRKEWVGLTEGELIDIQNCNRGFWTNAAKIEQLLKDKNT